MTQFFRDKIGLVDQLVHDFSPFILAVDGVMRRAVCSVLEEGIINFVSPPCHGIASQIFLQDQKLNPGEKTVNPQEFVCFAGGKCYN